MNNEISKFKVLSSLFWKLLERGGTQGIQFIVQIVLARLLVPADYGIIALLTVFIAVSQVFVQSGFNTALIQKKDTDELDFSSVFYLSLLVASLLYAILFFTAPFIAIFYGKSQLVSVLRVLSIVLFFGAFNSIQNAVVSRRFQFKKLFFSSTGALLISGTVGIYMAYAGYGVWALVGQQIVNQLSVTVILWFTVKWRPKLIFSFMRVKGLFSFGWKLLASSLIDTLYMNLRNLVIGKLYKPEMLGFYNRGDQFPSIIVTNIDGSIQSVMLPALSTQQDNKKRVKDMVRRAIVTSSFIIFPVMAVLVVISKSLVEILLTDKWLSCVPFLQISCLTYALWPIHTANLQAINAIGRSDIFLKLEIIKKLVGLTILIISVFYGIYAIALGGVMIGIISTVINAWPNKKLLNYSIKEQCLDILPSFILSLIMGLAVYSINFIGFYTWVALILQVVCGIILYIASARIFKLECFTYLSGTCKEIIKSKNLAKT